MVKCSSMKIKNWSVGYWSASIIAKFIVLFNLLSININNILFRNYFGIISELYNMNF